MNFKDIKILTWLDNFNEIYLSVNFFGICLIMAWTGSRNSLENPAWITLGCFWILFL